MLKMDINCDMGEGFGPWRMGQDEELLAYVSSVNIACGFHAGDPTVMRKTAEAAFRKGVKIGAHPGYPDLQGFGRRNMGLSPQEVFDSCVYQIGAMKSVAEVTGGKLNHVKPHGALYNAAAKNYALATAIAEATKAVDKHLILYGLAGSYLISAANETGLTTAAEAFADRTYQPDGSLTPRSNRNAVITSPHEAVKQVQRLIDRQNVRCNNGSEIFVQADTICIHGDGENAVTLAKAIWEMMQANKR